MNLHDDTISDFLDRCAKVNIKNPAAYIRTRRLQVYDYLKGAFPRGILPTDIDGEVELNGYFLRLEFKPESALREGRISKGQAKLFRRLARIPSFTIFVVGTNDDDKPTVVQIIRLNPETKTVVERLVELPDLERSLFSLCKNWATAKEQAPPPAY